MKKLSIKTKRLMRNSLIVASLAGVTITMGHGCGKMNSAGTSGAASASFAMGDSGGNGGGGGFVPKPGVPTASVVYAKQVLDSMIACTGTETASQATLLEYEKRKGSFTEYGFATEVTAPMIMAVAGLAGEICRDLVLKEKALAASDRRVFRSIDFTRGPSSIGSSDLADATRRLARLCWAREETPEELQIIDQEIRASFTGSNATETENAAIALCTGVLGSVDGYTL